MTQVLDAAIEKVRRLPEDEQAYAAHLLEQLAQLGEERFAVPPEHRAAILEGLAQIQRGEFATDQAVQDLIHKPWA